MHIPRIPGSSRIDRLGALARRSPSARRLELERLEARTALSGGLHAGLAEMDSYRARVAPALIGGVEASSTSREAAVAVPSMARGADAAPEVGRTGMSEAPGIQDFAATPLAVESSPTIRPEDTSLVPLAADLLEVLAGGIGIQGQAYRDGVPISGLPDDAAAATGSAPAAISPGLIRVGAAVAITEQEAGVAVPAAIAGPDGVAEGSRIATWVSGSIGRLEALAAVDGPNPTSQASPVGPPPALSSFARSEIALASSGDPGSPGPFTNVSTIVSGEIGPYVQAEASMGDPGSPGPDPNAPPAPPFLISLGRFALRNIDVIYNNYIQYFDIISGSMASRPGGIAPDGLAAVSDSTVAAVQGPQEVGWSGAGWMSYMMAGGRGPALSQGAASRGGEVPGPGSSPEEPVSPAPIAAGGIPLDILLSDPGSSTQDVSIGLQQIAELIPVEDSPLALVATLWTVPSESRSQPVDEGDPSGERAEPVMSSASPPPWAVFVIGLDEALERSGRDARVRIFPHVGRPGGGDGAGDAPEDRLEWRCPIIPTAEGRQRPDGVEGSSRYDGPAAIDPAAPSGGADSDRHLQSRSSGSEGPVARPTPEDGSPHEPGGGGSLTEGAVRSAWAASGSALIAGWLWARRRLRQGRRPGKIGREDQCLGGRGLSGGESP